MKLVNEGLTLWYLGPDTPGPAEEDADRSGLSLIVGAKPPSPSNSVLVNYRVDGKSVRQIVARDIGTDYTRQAQYFHAAFPRFVEGRSVEYGPVLSCAGRQVPAPRARPELPSKFTLAPLPSEAPRTGPQRDRAVGATAQVFTPRLEFVSSIRTTFSSSFDLFGDTPEGVRINYYLEDGQAVGPLLNARVLPRGGDFMTIRRDGVGALTVRAVYQTIDGALLSADYYGFLDLGEDGYSRALKGQFPELAALQLAPRFMTGESEHNYRWMNRCQFIAVGQVRLRDRSVVYDLFAVHNDPLPTL